MMFIYNVKEYIQTTQNFVNLDSKITDTQFTTACLLFLNTKTY